MAEGYRKSSLTPEAKAELARAEVRSAAERRYRNAWKRHRRFDRGGPIAASITIIWAPLAVISLGLGHGTLAVCIIAGLVVVDAYLMGIGLKRCPRCRSVFPRLENFRLAQRCLSCDLRVGEVPKPDDD